MAVGVLLLLALSCRSGPPEFSVTDFGAAADGSRDDLPAVVRAVRAAVAAGGGTVRLPSGTFLWDGTLVLDHPGITLAGSGGTVIQAARSLFGSVARTCLRT